MSKSRASAIVLAAGLGAATLLTGCSGHSAAPKAVKTTAPHRTTSPGRIYGVRTTADDRSLVIGYGNGGCNISGGRAEVVETPKVVTVTTLVASGPTSAACPIGGLSRTLVAHLHAPLGKRELIDGATRRTIRPFDGSTLLRASAFPDAVKIRTDEVPPGAVDAGLPAWTQHYRRATPEPGCRQSPDITVTQGTGISPLSGSSLSPVPGGHTVGGTLAQLFQFHDAKQTPGLYYLRWEPLFQPGRAVLIFLSQQCASGHEVSPTQLMHFANGLR